MIRIERNPSRIQLLVFGLCWLLFFGFWGTASWLKEGITATAVFFWSLAFIIPAAGLIQPKLLRIVYILASYITLPIGLIISTAILLVIYYLVLTPIGIVLRMSGYDPMRRKFDTEARSYWAVRNPATGRDRYFKQF